MNTLASTLLLPYSVYAATKDWSSESDWSAWSRTNTSATAFSGSLSLSPTSNGWSEIALGPTNLHGGWGATASDVWFVGTSAAIYHYNGSTLAQIPSFGSPTVTDTLNDIWGFSASNIWAVGANGRIVHYNGSAWSAVSSPTSIELKSIWGSSASDIWAVGASGGMTDQFIHYNGSAWSTVASPSGDTFGSVWGTSASDIWVIDLFGGLSHYNGTNWSSVTTSAITGQLQDVWAAAANQVWAITDQGEILTFNGTSWSTDIQPPTTTFSSIWGSSATDIWALGRDELLSDAVLYHYNGSSWSNVANPTSGILSKVWGLTTDDVWAVGSAGVYHYTASSYETMGVATVAFDGTTSTSWDSLTKSETLNGQSVQYYAKSSSSASCPTGGGSSWMDWDGQITFTGDTASLSGFSASRYLCLGVELNGNGTTTPLISSLTLSYAGGSPSPSPSVAASPSPSPSPTPTPVPTPTPSNAAPTVGTLGSTSLTNGSAIADAAPGAFTFVTADTDGSDTVQYQIQISGSASFSPLLIDYTSALETPGTKSFTVGQAASGGTYAVGSASTTLSDGNYYWRVRAIDNSSAASSYATANSGGVAFSVDATAPAISSIATSDVTPTQAIVTWITNEAASTQVQYGLTTSYGSQTIETDTSPRVTSHTAMLSSLSCGTIYHFRVLSKDSLANQGLSSDQAITTTSCPEPEPSPSPSPSPASSPSPSASPSSTPATEVSPSPSPSLSPEVTRVPKIAIASTPTPDLVSNDPSALPSLVEQPDQNVILSESSSATDERFVSPSCDPSVVAGIAKLLGLGQTDCSPKVHVAISVRLDKDRFNPAEVISGYISVTNIDKEKAALYFPTKKQADYQIISSVTGKTLYRWSSGKFFTPFGVSVNLRPDGQYHWQLRHDPRRFTLASGEYRLAAEVVGYGQVEVPLIIDGSVGYTAATVDAVASNDSQGLLVTWKRDSKTEKATKFQVYCDDQLIGETAETEFLDTASRSTQCKYRIAAIVAADLALPPPPQSAKVSILGTITAAALLGLIGLFILILHRRKEEAVDKQSKVAF